MFLVLYYDNSENIFLEGSFQENRSMVLFGFVEIWGFELFFLYNQMELGYF